MAIFESVIFQRMRKSVGNITTYEAGGKQVLRQNPLQRKDKKSEPQLKHRDRMRTLKKICGYAIALSTVGFCTTSRKTAWNRFVQANLMREGVGRGLAEPADWLDLRFAGGPLHAPLMTAEVDWEQRTVTFRWERQADRPNCLGDDRLFGIVVDIDKREVMLEELGRRGESGEATFPFVQEGDGRYWVAYGFAKNAGGTRASDSVSLALWEKE